MENIWPKLSLQKKNPKLSSEMICPRSIWLLKVRADTELVSLESVPRTVLTNSCYCFGCQADELCCQVAICFPSRGAMEGASDLFFFPLTLAHTRDGIKEARFKPGQPEGFV